MNLDRPVPPGPYEVLPPVPAFELTSHDISEGQALSLDHVADMAGGANISPHLRWSGHPEATRAFAVTCYDPDAPTGSGFWHWALAGLGPDVVELVRGAGSTQGGGLPPGSFQLKNDAGQSSYTGAAPPQGDRPHRYFFAVHALGTDKLDIGPGATPAYLGFNITFNIVARAVIMATYQVP